MGKQKNGQHKNTSASPANAPATIISSNALVAAAQMTASAVRQLGMGEETLPRLDRERMEDFTHADEADKTKLRAVLNELSAFSKQVAQLQDENKKRSDELSRKEQAFENGRVENKKREQALKLQTDELNRQDKEMKREQAQQVEKQRALELRELEARTGFAAQNAAALSDLRTAIADLETRRNDLHRDLMQTAQKARDDDAEREVGLLKRETEVSSREARQQQKERRLETEWLDIENQRIHIRDEAQKDVAQEVARLKLSQQKAEARLVPVYRDWQEAERNLAQFQELSEVLNGRPALELLEETATQKRKISQLENLLAQNQNAQLQADYDSVCTVRDALKGQLDEVHIELADTKAQLQRLRLGVSDKTNLELEKRALEKHNQILAARLNDLGQTVDDLTQSQHAATPFPQLSGMDASDAHNAAPKFASVRDLQQFATQLQQRIAQAEENVSLYFRLEDIQLLLAGLAMSQLHIFQGMSGTGKTSLAKAFAKAVGGHCTDISVQAGWRDRDDLLGHYNAFEKRFYEKDCLQGLYQAQTPAYSNRCNIILLDEMNLSRPEQYFAEFLSAIEKNDVNERLISLSESRLPNPPEKLIEGRKIVVPNNVWFVGTANHDETTNEFADKTYDRAHVMNLPRHEETFAIEKRPSAIYAFDSLIQCFDAAVEKHSEEVDGLLEELTTASLSNVLEQRFDLGWGNRFARQAKRFIPVFMAAGGKKEDALDHLLASRIFRRGKVTGRYDTNADDLNAAEQALNAVFNTIPATPSRCLALLAADRSRKESGV